MARVWRVNVFIERMFGHGIGCSVHYIPLHLQPYWRDTYKLILHVPGQSAHLRANSVAAALHTHDRGRCGPGSSGSLVKIALL